MPGTDGFTIEFYKQGKMIATKTLKKEVKETDPTSYQTWQNRYKNIKTQTNNPHEHGCKNP